MVGSMVHATRSHLLQLCYSQLFYEYGPMVMLLLWIPTLDLVFRQISTIQEDSVAIVNGLRGRAFNQ